MIKAFFISNFSSLIDKAMKYYKYNCTFCKNHKIENFEICNTVLFFIDKSIFIGSNGLMFFCTTSLMSG